MYVKPEMRKSLLAKMLTEILETRVMVKSGMKQDKDDKTLQQLLNNRQLALKLLANVTYGYTSASFSGRMPCSEVADSIVQTARETLEKAIALIHSVERWGAEVVYGDTDSLFVYLKGRTRDQAFNIGQEIADAVTNANPRPIKLKFEKVYHPCVLLAKKRYVGFKYEHRKQQEPDFDAKGIETVRRDGTPADQKIEEKALKLLFRTQDLSKVKSYFQAQCMKIMAGKVSIQDFLFAKEVKLGTYSDRGPPPPGALIATRKMLQDARQEPQYGERVPYVVITGAPGARLIDRCVDPERLLNDDHVELDAEYYITKNIIPPLERIFNLVGANVRAWYDEMPKVQRVRTVRAPAQLISAGASATKKTLESYLHSTTCLVCRAKLPPPPPMPALGANQAPPLPICEECIQQPALVLYALGMRKLRAEKRVRNVRDVCRSCSGLSFEDDVKCDSRDCPVFYTRVKEESALESLKERVDGVVEIFEEQEAEKNLEW
jgi:DNA polymerase zeta